MWWKRAPFLRLLPGFIAGIALAGNELVSVRLTFLILILSITCLAIFNLTGNFLRFRSPWISGLLIQLILLSLGALHCLDQSPDIDQLFLKNDERHQLLLEISEAPVEKSHSFQARASIVVAMQAGKKFHVKGDVLVYFKKGTSLPEEGGLIWIQKELQNIRNNGNPGEFDFKTYCRRQHIGFSVYLEEKDILKRIEQPANKIKRWLIKCQHYIRTKLAENIRAKKELGLAEALLIGYRGDLDKELSSYYSTTGTVHIIAISGMHLSLIYTLLLWLFKAIPERKWIIWPKTALLLSILWLFSFLCGGQPSILRATISFSFLLLAGLFQRRPSNLNGLAGAAFLLLCMDPLYLWDPGFQLSFAALSGILLFNKPIRGLIQSNNIILGYIYDLFAVTLAAQVLTFPISIFYFHQFPVYFLFSNLLAVPLSGIILVAEILLLILSPLPFLSAWTGKWIRFLIRTMNDWIERTATLPGSSLSGLEINQWQLLLFYLFILLMAVFFMNRKKIWLWSGCLLIILFLLIGQLRTIRSQNGSRFIAYSLKKSSLAEYHSGGISWTFFKPVHEGVPVLEKAYSFLRIRHAIAFDGYGSYLLAGKRLLIREGYQPDEAMVPDWILLHGNASLETDLRLASKQSVVITDQTVPLSRSKKIKRLCDSLHIAFHSIRDKGAFISEW